MSFSHRLTSVLFTVGLWLPVLTYSMSSEVRAQGTSAAVRTKRLNADWRKSVPLSANPLLPAPDRNPADEPPVSRGTIWVENGWLMAERRTAANELEWQVVLAEVTDAEPPEIESNAEHGIFRLRVRDGRYFIRDEQESFRCLRQRKDGIPWPRLEIPTADANTQDLHMARQVSNPPTGPAIPALKDLPWLMARTVNSWNVLAAGPTRDDVDCLVRLSHRDLDGEQKRYTGGIQLSESYLARLVGARADGSLCELLDDGELLVARRLENWRAKQELERLARKKELIGQPPRDLPSGAWLNVEHAPTWDQFRGRVVLLDIERGGDEAQWLILGSLQRKYAERGLVIIGIADDVDSDQQATAFARTLKDHAIAWPFKLEKSRARSTNYEFPFYSHPHYVLVGRDGNVAWIGQQRPPHEAEIRKLLDAE